MIRTINEDNLFALIIKGSSVLLAILTIGGLFFSIKDAMGALAGGIIAIVNFCWIRNALQRILCQQPASATLYAQIRFVARLAVTAIVLYLIITSKWFSLAGLLAGLSVVVLNIIVLSIYRAVSAGG